MKHNEQSLARTLVRELKEASEKETEEILQTLVLLLAKRHQTARIPHIVRAIENAWKEAYALASIEVTTAFPLPQSLIKRLEKMANGAELKTHVDKTLIAGASIRIDDRIIDGSVDGHLRSLKRVLADI